MIAPIDELELYFLQLQGSHHSIHHFQGTHTYQMKMWCENCSNLNSIVPPSAKIKKIISEIISAKQLQFTASNCLQFVV